MYAIIQTGGRQYKVSPGDVIEVNRLPVEVGQTIDLSDVLMIGNGAETVVGRPVVSGAVVRARVASNFRSPKIIVFKYKPKVRYRNFNTHRQDLTRLVIKEILPTGVSEEAEGTTGATANLEATSNAPTSDLPVLVPPAGLPVEVTATSELPVPAVPAELPVPATPAELPAVVPETETAGGEEPSAS